MKLHPQLTLLAVSTSLLLFAIGCGQKTENKASSHPSDPALAWVAGDTIHLSEFESRYRSTPHIGQGLPAVEGYLQAMLTEKMLAAMTREEGFDSSAGILALVDQLHREAVVETYLEQQLAQLPPASDSLLRIHLDRLDHDLLLNALVFRDSSAAAQAFKRAKEGASFDQLADLIGPGDRQIRRHGLSYDQSSPAFEEVSYSLSSGEVGSPIFLDGAWWLVQQVDNRRSAATDSLTLSDKVKKVRGVLEKRQRQALQDQLVARAMKGRSINIEEKPFYALAHQLKSLLPTSVPNDAPLTAKLNLPLPETGFASLSPSTPLVHLTGFNKSTWTVGDVERMLAVSPRPLVSGPEALLARRLRTEILFLAEFETLYDLASNTEAASSPTVKRESSMWRDHVQAQAGMRILARRVGTVLPFDTPEKWDDASMAKTDTLIVQLLSEYGDSLGLGVNRSLLARVPTSEQPVVLRKTHFPNRPLAPMPVGYRWGVLWSQAED